MIDHQQTKNFTYYTMNIFILNSCCVQLNKTINNRGNKIWGYNN